MVSRVKSLLLEKSYRGLHNNERQWTGSCVAHNSALHPPPSPFPLNPANQRPLLFVYKHNILRPAAFKIGPATLRRGSEPQNPKNEPWLQPRTSPGARSRSAGVCSARWTTSSCAENWDRGWRRWASRTAAAGTSTSRRTRRWPAGSSGRRCRWTALLHFTRSPGTAEPPPPSVLPAPRPRPTGWALPTRRTARASPTRACVPQRRRRCGGRGRAPGPWTSPASAQESQVSSEPRVHVALQSEIILGGKGDMYMSRKLTVCLLACRFFREEEEDDGNTVHAESHPRKRRRSSFVQNNKMKELPRKNWLFANLFNPTSSWNLRRSGTSHSTKGSHLSTILWLFDLSYFFCLFAAVTKHHFVLFIFNLSTLI